MNIILVRGPAGVGKSTIAKLLARRLGARYISFDAVMKKEKLDTIVGDGIPAQNFIRANEIILRGAREDLELGKGLVLDGCFYRKAQLKHIKAHAVNSLHIFTLDATLEECIARNNLRKNPMAIDQVAAVYHLVAKLRVGRRIITSGKSLTAIVTEIMGLLSCR